MGVFEKIKKLTSFTRRNSRATTIDSRATTIEGINKEIDKFLKKTKKYTKKRSKYNPFETRNAKQDLEKSTRLIGLAKDIGQNEMTNIDNGVSTVGTSKIKKFHHLVDGLKTRQINIEEQVAREESNKKRKSDPDKLGELSSVDMGKFYNNDGVRITDSCWPKFSGKLKPKKNAQD
ncbi:hypothetical protein [Aquimarina algiphila]|uniref:hypothetical protein n=1 Tax=Aquimarina algiphila TaxID=2047982 RepID=UPI002330412E|nr:hypothetical protein [Aquimarina algiphila]